jgi:hypothetical protein
LSRFITQNILLNHKIIRNLPSEELCKDADDVLSVNSGSAIEGMKAIAGPL